MLKKKKACSTFHVQTSSEKFNKQSNELLKLYV